MAQVDFILEYIVTSLDVRTTMKNRQDIESIRQHILRRVHTLDDVITNSIQVYFGRLY